MSRSPTNIYHCCVFKTGSQWIRGILQHPMVKEACGLDCYRYEDYLPDRVDLRKITERFFDTPFPENKILSPLFLSFDCFKSIIKPNNYRAFFVIRDPRDITVSLYYSFLYSHREVGKISVARSTLQQKTQSDGLLQVIDWTIESKVFDALSSWGKVKDTEYNIKIFRFEDLISDNQFKHFQELMKHCQIDIPDATLKVVLSDLSFQSLSGRSKGSEDISSHYRKGVSGDWKNHFNSDVESHFFESTGNLLQDTGYL